MPTRRQRLVAAVGAAAAAVVLLVWVLGGAGGAQARRSQGAASLSGRLVIVPGHSVFTGTDLLASRDEGSWLLEPFQQGQLSTMLAHVERAAAIARMDSTVTVIFSGGQTRAGATQLSEGQSYWLVARALGWLEGIEGRTTTEEHALDSLDNLMLSVCRYYEFTGKYPAYITVVGFEFKRLRFDKMHRAAMGYPADRFEYIGIDPDDSRAAERLSGEVGFTSPPYDAREALG